MGETEDAATRALTGERVGLAHLRLLLATVPERDALDYAATRPKGLDIALSLLPQAGNINASLDALILERSVVLDEMAARHRSTAESSDPEIAAHVASVHGGTSAARRPGEFEVRIVDKRHPTRPSSLKPKKRRNEANRRWRNGVWNFAPSDRDRPSDWSRFVRTCRRCRACFVRAIQQKHAHCACTNVIRQRRQAS